MLDAVESTTQASADVTVTEVAHQLGIDWSGVSRVVSAAVNHGYLDRRPSPADGGSVLLAVTPTGAELLRNSHAWQEQVFSELTFGWAPADAHQFGNYLQRLAAELPAAGVDVR